MLTNDIALVSDLAGTFIVLLVPTIGTSFIFGFLRLDFTCLAALIVFDPPFPDNFKYCLGVLPKDFAILAIVLPFPKTPIGEENVAPNATVLRKPIVPGVPAGVFLTFLINCVALLGAFLISP